MSILSREGGRIRRYMGYKGLGAWQNWEEHTEIPIYLLLPRMPSHSHFQHSPSECYTVTSDEPTLTQHHHPRAIVYMRVRFCCCRFNEFGQMFNHMYPPLVSYTVCLLPPRSSVVHVFILPSTPDSWQPLVFLLLHSCDSWGRKEWDTTERLNWTELSFAYSRFSCS